MVNEQGDPVYYGVWNATREEWENDQYSIFNTLSYAVAHAQLECYKKYFGRFEREVRQFPDPR